MNFTFLDWSAIVAYLAITLFLGLYFRSRSGKSVDDYFVSGRNVSWWLAGTSMVATTFAADTPLVVTGLVYTQGIAGNWLWWAFLLSGMMTVFLFARLWRRSGLLTDVQFAEMRYSGKPAAFLRGFRAVYLGLLMNCLILGWVTKAMTSIVATTLGVSDHSALAVCVFFLIPFTGLYVALGGLWGVLWTDLFQFALKMTIVIGVAWYAVSACGGMSALLSKLGEMRAAAGPGAGDATSFFPDFSRPIAQEGLWLLPVMTFLVNIGFRSLVQHRALCRAALALDPHRTGCHRPLPALGASGNRLHAHRESPCPAGSAWHRHRRLHGRVHVHDRHATELGSVVSGLRFLPPLH